MGWGKHAPSRGVILLPQEELEEAYENTRKQLLEDKNLTLPSFAHTRLRESTTAALSECTCCYYNADTIAIVVDLYKDDFEWLPRYDPHLCDGFPRTPEEAAQLKKHKKLQEQESRANKKAAEHRRTEFMRGKYTLPF